MFGWTYKKLIKKPNERNGGKKERVSFIFNEITRF